MSDPKTTFVPCPACKGLSFVVIYQPRDMLARVQCTDCDRELIAVAMAPPDEPLTMRFAPI